MASRMEKYYYEENNDFGTRSQKNSELYKRISDSEINDFDRNSNATVLADVKNEIDVEKIKKILDTKYNVAPRRKSIKIENDVEDDNEIISLESTREYDINAILEKAKEEKEDIDDYELDRLKKLKDTQFNILSNLNLTKNEDEVETEEEKTLINLINTITEREMLNRERELDPLDILSDLKDGNDEENVSEDDKTLPSSEIGNGDDKIEEEFVTDKTIDVSFYTESNKFTDSDFDDFNDLKAEVSSHKIILKFIISLLIIGIIIGIFIVLNFVMNLGLF